MFLFRIMTLYVFVLLMVCACGDEQAITSDQTDNSMMSEDNQSGSENNWWEGDGVEEENTENNTGTDEGKDEDDHAAPQGCRRSARQARLARWQDAESWSDGRTACPTTVALREREETKCLCGM